MHTNRRLTKTFSGLHNVEVFSIPLRDYLVVYELVPGCRVGWEPSHLHLVPSLALFADYSGLMLSDFKTSKAHDWKIEITEMFVSVLV